LPEPELATTTTPTAEGQRVSCPNCGHFLFLIRKVDPPTAGIVIRIKCKGGHCHKFCDVELRQGQLAVMLVTA